MSTDFDVSQFEIEDSALLTVQNIEGTDDLLVNGEPVTIELYSPGSKVGVKALHKSGQQAQLRLQGIMRGRRAKTAPEDAEIEQVEKLVTFTKAINNFPIEGGARALYENPKLGWIRAQVEGFLGEPSNFSKPSTKSSPSTSDNAPG